LAFRLLRAGRGVKLVGFDIGPALVKTLKKLGPENMLREELHAAINRWEQEKLKKAKGVGTVRDKADCLRVFADFGNTLGDSCSYAEHLFATTGTIQLLSGHKAKGLEWDTVYHLDPHRIPSPYVRSEEDREQERNVEYVINTRSKRDLFFVTMEGFEAAP
jgi:superfamily I DNA/RNA helicase